jgi:hypothetical protein
VEGGAEGAGEVDVGAEEVTQRGVQHADGDHQRLCLISHNHRRKNTIE